MTQLTPYHEDQELDNNTSSNIHFRDILEQRMTRHQSHYQDSKWSSCLGASFYTDWL